MLINDLSTKAAQIEGRIQGGTGGRKPLAVAGSDSLIQLMELDGHVRVMIQIGEEETSAGLRLLIPLALRWRDWVFEVQGPWIVGGRGALLNLLDELQREGTSYQRLATRLTRTLEALLTEFLAWERQSRTRHRIQTQPPVGADPDFWPNQFAKVHAEDLLTDLGITNEETALQVEDALRRLRDGKRPFVGSGPITRQRVINMLRAWRRRHATSTKSTRQSAPKRTQLRR